MTKLSSLISGIVFGLGLTISGMVNPEKVLGFLNIFYDWDPSLMFVLIGAILIFSPLYFIFKRKSRPIFSCINLLRLFLTYLSHLELDFGSKY